MGNFDGKVAFVTGAARGMGRSHAIGLAAQGADIIAVDICAQIGTVPYPMATPEDLAETARAVEALDRRIIARQADVRDRAALRATVETGAAVLGPVDIVVANAGIAARSPKEPDQTWLDIIDVNLTGVFYTIEVTWPEMVERGAGGSIILVSSTGGLTGVGGTEPGRIGYTAAKHGVVGLMRSYANFLAPHSIRVNSVHPTGVRTPMVENDFTRALRNSRPDAFPRNALPVELIEPADVTSAIVWLASDGARYVTGVTSAGRCGLRELQVISALPPACRASSISRCSDEALKRQRSAG